MPENKRSNPKNKESAEGDGRQTDTVKFLGLAVAGMNSFLSRIALLPDFADAKIALPEWLILSSLARNPELRSANLSRNLGLTVQRVDAIITALTQKNLVGKDDGETKNWALTESGRTRLADLETGLKNHLTENLAGRERFLNVLVRTLRQLTRKTNGGEKSED